MNKVMSKDMNDDKKKMQLLVFAHRREAQSFFEYFHFTPVEYNFPGLFFCESSGIYLLITQEGMMDALAKTSAVLAQLHQKLNLILNIGIAGSLRDDMAKKSIVYIRSIYAHNGEAMEFKSFHTKESETEKIQVKIDCLTFPTRVLKKEEREKLSHFADLVDRELWAIAHGAHLFKLPISAIKMISDGFDSTDFCHLVKDESLVYSKALLDFYLKNSHNFKPSLLHSKKNKSEADFMLIINHPKLYFTTSQERHFQKIAQAYIQKKSFSASQLAELVDQHIKELSSDELLPKELTKLILKKLEEDIYPLQTHIKQEINKHLGPLIESGAQVNIDPHLENQDIQISFKISSMRDHKKLLLALEKFNYQKIKDIFNGHLDSI